MSDETVAAASSAADVFGDQQPTLEEYSKYRQSGELPARFKPAEQAESAPADTPEETEEAEGDEPETEPESDPEEAQEQPPKGSGAEKRIKQLLAKTKELEAQLAGKQDVKPESSPVPQQPLTRTKPTAEDKDSSGNPKPTVDDKNPDGTPKYTDWDTYNEDFVDWKAEQKVAEYKREQAQQEALKALNSTLEKARERYDDADEVIFPAAKTINEAKIPQAVKEVFAGSDLFIDLCYVVGSDPDELKQFVALAQSNPRAAIGKVFEYERGIREELSKPRDDKGKFTAAPETKKTSAPKPPSPVGGGSSRAFDVSDESLSPEEWMRQRNKQLERRKG
jgi:hypothetical protein